MSFSSQIRSLITPIAFSGQMEIKDFFCDAQTVEAMDELTIPWATRVQDSVHVKVLHDGTQLYEPGVNEQPLREFLNASDVPACEVILADMNAPTYYNEPSYAILVPLRLNAQPLPAAHAYGFGLHVALYRKNLGRRDYAKFSSGLVHHGIAAGIERWVGFNEEGNGNDVAAAYTDRNTFSDRAWTRIWAARGRKEHISYEVAEALAALRGPSFYAIISDMDQQIPPPDAVVGNTLFQLLEAEEGVGIYPEMLGYKLRVIRGDFSG